MIRQVAAALLAALAVTGCATNPVTGRPNVVMGTQQGEKEQSRRYYEQIIRAYGLYEDQALQDYVQTVGAKVAKNSHLPDWDFKFTVLDDDSVNAFTTGGGYVYVHRGLLSYMTSEAELATVLGHEIGHVTARHPARAQTRGVLASVLATGAAIMTGSSAVAQLANIGAEAWMQGYGRENEMEADRLGLEYATKTGYRPEAMAEVFKVFKAQESFEVQRAKDEGREPNLYHGVFSSHPAPDARAVQAAKGAANITTEPEGGWIDNRDAYMRAIDGLPYGSSRAQGIVRDNRFYHADMGITLAFPRGWHIENQRDRILAYTKNKDAVMQVTSPARPEKRGPREFLLEQLKGESFSKGEALSVNGMEGYTLVTRRGSPLDGGEGPVRWAVLYRGKSTFLFGGASRSGTAGLPADDGLFKSTIETTRDIKASEYPLAQPYRIKVIKATEQTKLDDYAKNVPVEKYQKEELQLLNGLYPNGKVKPGQYLKIVE
ncbi:MAG TPA: M48 family metalloprotease [Steroidobacteraceae bacterium]|nr:M48 family metalloprotease [Steroidobacteraceae bacterium]